MFGDFNIRTLQHVSQLGCKIFILGNIQILTGKGPEQPDLSCSFLEQGITPADLQMLLPLHLFSGLNVLCRKSEEIHTILNFDFS